MALLRPLSALSRKGYGPLMSLAEVTCAVEILCTPLILPQKIRSQLGLASLQTGLASAAAWCGPSGLLPSKTHPTCAQLLHIRVLCLAHEAAAYCMLDCSPAVAAGICINLRCQICTGSSTSSKPYFNSSLPLALQAATSTSPETNRDFVGSSLASSHDEVTLCPACAEVQADGRLVWLLAGLICLCMTLLRPVQMPKQ